jgi:hypothetical protein
MEDRTDDAADDADIVVSDAEMELMNRVVTRLKRASLKEAPPAVAAPAPPPSQEETIEIDDAGSSSNGASFLSRLLFTWMTPLIRKGHGGELRHEHMFRLDDKHDVDVLLREYARLSHDADGRRQPLQRVMLRLVWREVLWANLLQLVWAAMQLAIPLVLREFVRSVRENTGDGVYFAFAMFAASIVGSICNQHHFHILFGVGQRLRSLVIALVYRRVIRMRMAASAAAASDTVNLMSNDAQKFFDLMPNFGLLLTAPSMVIVASVLLVLTIGWAGLGMWRQVLLSRLHVVVLSAPAPPNISSS